MKSMEKAKGRMTDEIWEFKTLFNRTHYRLFAFWEKREKTYTVVISTHGLIKKTDKTPQGDSDNAKRLRKKYLDLKDRAKLKLIVQAKFPINISANSRTPQRETFENELRFDTLDNAIQLETRRTWTSFRFSKSSNFENLRTV